MSLPWQVELPGDSRVRLDAAPDAQEPRSAVRRQVAWYVNAGSALVAPLVVPTVSLIE